MVPAAARARGTPVMRAVFLLRWRALPWFSLTRRFRSVRGRVVSRAVAAGREEVAVTSVRIPDRGTKVRIGAGDGRESTPDHGVERSMCLGPGSAAAVDTCAQVRTGPLQQHIDSVVHLTTGRHTRLAPPSESQPVAARHRGDDGDLALPDLSPRSHSEVPRPHEPTARVPQDLHSLPCRGARRRRLPHRRRLLGVRWLGGRFGRGQVGRPGRWDEGRADHAQRRGRRLLGPGAARARRPRPRRTASS